MKTIIKNVFLIGVTTFGIVSCGENSWNNTYLKGFEDDPEFSNVQTFDYTLTADDYTAISKNSTNVELAKAGGFSKELSAVGTLGYLNDKVTPAEFIPPFLTDPSFKYFTLTEGSAINITYRIAENLPANMVSMNAAATYTVSSEDYQSAYGSETDFAESFSPLAPASSGVPRILKIRFPDAVSGDYVVVNYNNSDTEPVFQKATFEMTDVIKSTLKKGDDLNATGIVTGICAQGFVLTDKGGSILVYFGSSYDVNAYSVGDQVSVKGPVSSYNKGLQVTGADATVRKMESEEYTYPAPKVYTGEDMDEAIQRSNDALGVYCQITGVVTVSGRNYNVNVDGATVAVGSLYQLTDAQKALFESGNTYTISGYFLSISQSNKQPKYFNVLVTDAKVATRGAMASTRAVNIPSAGVNAVYMYNGSSWAVASDVTILQPSDYAEMGVSSYLTTEQADKFIPMFIERKYPYALEDDVKLIMYAVKGSNGIAYRTEEYKYDGSVWQNSISGEGVITQTSQFVYKEGSWKMDPSIELTLPAGRNQPTSTWFFQTCVDWVKANVSGGENYVSSYGNNEYYCGTSAYQGNIDLRASAAKSQYAAGYANMTDEQIVALEKERFEKEVCPGALAVLYPNIAPAPGVEPTVTIHFSAYNGTSTDEYVIIYKVVGKAKFEFVSCSWNK